MSGIVSRGRRGSVVVPNWRTEDQTLDAYAFRIACWLASHADRYTEATVSRNLIAKVLGISRTKVSESLDALQALSIISAEPVGERGRLIITFDFEVWETPHDWTPHVQSQDARRPVLKETQKKTRSLPIRLRRNRRRRSSSMPGGKPST